MGIPLARVIVLLCVVGCAGEQGPEGPAGAMGALGPQGPQGMPGAGFDPTAAIANAQTPQVADFNITGVGVIGTQARVGPAAPIAGTSADVLFQVTANRDAEVAIASASNTATERSEVFFDRSRGTLAAPTDVVDGDPLMRIAARGFSQSGRRNAASIIARVDGVPSGTTVPGMLSFLTAAAGGALTERLRISSAGNVGIGTSTPGFPLDVVGGVRMSYSGTVVLPLASTQTITHNLGIPGTATQLIFVQNGDVPANAFMVVGTSGATANTFVVHTTGGTGSANARYNYMILVK